jgi:hypothetical protein
VSERVQAKPVPTETAQPALVLREIPQPAQLIATAKQIVAEQAELVLVRRANFTKPTHHHSDTYDRTVLERATRLVKSTSGINYVALRDRYTDNVKPTIELVSVPLTAYKSAVPDAASLVCVFTKDEVIFRGSTELTPLESDSVANYLGRLSSGLEPHGLASPASLPRIIREDEVFEPTPGTVLNIQNYANYLPTEQ